MGGRVGKEESRWVSEEFVINDYIPGVISKHV